MLPNVRIRLIAEVLQASAAHFTQASTFIFSVFTVSLQFNKVVAEEEAANMNVVTLMWRLVHDMTLLFLSYSMI